jgi:hypothetical protein
MSSHANLIGVSVLRQWNAGTHLTKRAERSRDPLVEHRGPLLGVLDLNDRANDFVSRCGPLSGGPSIAQQGSDALGSVVSPSHRGLALVTVEGSWKASEDLLTPLFPLTLPSEKSILNR